MIAASEPQEFIPFGRQQVLEHPGAIQIGIQEHQYQTECALSNRLKDVVISDSGKKTESWILRETINESIECEEELYYKSKTVVWSVGPALTENSSNRILKCCYTSETPISEALWCNFHLSTPDIASVYLREPGNIKQININSKNGKNSEDLRNCVCIMDTNHIKFYTKSGKEYMTTLQFKVLKIWAMKYGLIFERQLEKKDSVEGMADYKEKKPELPTASPQSFRVSYKTSSVDLRRQSIEQSFLQNQKNMTDFTDKSSFGSTQYLNLPFNVQEDISPLTITTPFSSSFDEKSVDLPIIFSLSHPLDEICPVVAKNDTLSYISNPDVKIIFTSESPSLCMTYDGKTKLHSVHLIRKAQPQESEICLHRESMLSRNSRTHHSFNTTGKPCFSNSANSSFNLQPGNVSIPAFLNARTRKSLGLTHNVFSNLPNSPFPTFERPRHSSPIPSRNISPAFSHNIFTPSPRRNDSSLNSLYGGTPNRIESRMMTEDIEYAEPKPLYPQICFQSLWTESCSSDNLGFSVAANKAFLSKDLCGQSYLCYLLRNINKLNLLEMKSNKDESCVIFGAESSVNAKDACELTSLNMMAIIGLDGGVELYSGVTPVAKILISGVPSCVATSSYLSDSNSGPTFFKRSSLNAFPKRSSLISQSILSQSQQSPLFNDSLSQLSPVTTLESSDYDKLTPNVTAKTSNFVSSPREGYLVALRDNVASRISLEFSTGILFRLEMPNFGNSSLVKSCLNALRQVLPKELFLKLSIKWYCTRNVPGCHNIDAEEEWFMFSDVLLELMGYDVELLKGTKLDIDKSPVIRAKKQKKCEKSGDEDWNYLIESKHHELCFDHTRNVLGFGRVNNDIKMQTDFESFSGITDTPIIPSRSSTESRFDLFDSTKTPVDKSRHLGGKFKSSFSRLQKKSLDSIDETPFQPKMAFGKTKVNTNRLKMCFDEGDISPIAPHETPRRTYEEDTYVNKKGPLYPFITWVLFALHLLYEDMKLNDLKRRFLPTLVKLLHHLACDLKLSDYVHHYWTDFPNICLFNESTCRAEPRIEISNFPMEFKKTPPNIFRHFYEMMLKKNVEPFPFVFRINNRTKDLIQIIGLLSYGYENPGISMDALVRHININGRNVMEKPMDKGKSPRTRSHRPIPHRVVLLMVQMGITQDRMQTFPPGVSLILYEALYSCRDNPGFGWSKEAYKLAMRHDLASFCRQNSKEEVGPTNELIMPSGSNNCKNSSSTIRMNMDLEEDGMEDLTNMDILKLRFSTDQRVLEARRMLQSAQPVRITIQQRPDVTDHEFIQEQEKHLYAICLRTMALPVGRGMMTLRTSTPVITEKLPIPPLCLTGRVPPTDKVVDMSHIEVASNMNVWPLFHNGVAAGLRISPNAPDIDSQWIIFNKPKTNNEEVIEHAGFLMALGLNGHLNNLIDTNIFHYLIKINEMTSVGLLLGIAASKRGTMDPYTVRIVSLHIEAMLPPTGIELDVDVVVEPAALISLGFLFQGTAHRHIAQVLLQEIGRPPGPEMANSVDRESYSLAAGLALGLVLFGRGAKLSGIGDMAIADTLHHYMVGGPKRPYLGSQKEKYRTPSFLIWEGDLVNTHVTGPGAVLALGMLYFNTGNKAVAEWLKAPETQHLLEVVLPDALLLRTLAKGLILWDEIEPTESWVMSHVPEFTRPYCLVKPETNADKCIDYETMDQAYCNIVAGACMAIGLRFAGSAYEEAFETLLSYAKMFTSLLGKNIGELCGRSTIETCLNVVTVSLAMVMAGTGDLEVLRLCRYLRSRVGPTNTVVTYGSHLATHMAIGLLFLGGGAYTLSTSPEAIAALLCAFYPKWPIHSNDNRYHLQALRHLYVLAVEPRLLLPRDIDTRTLCYAHITCMYLDLPLYRGKIVKLRAPCLLPELNLLKEVRIDDNRYWSIIFTRDKNWEDFTNILSECSFVDVKQRAGCLSYLEDPQGFRSLLAQTLTSDDVIPWTIRVETIFGFSSDPILVNFTQYFLEGRDNRGNKTVEDKMVMWLTYIAYYCLTKDKLSLLPIWVSLLKAGRNVLFNSSSIDVWQLKLMWCQALRSSGSNSALIPPDTVLSIKQFFHNCFESWETDILRIFKDYLRNKLDPSSKDQDKLTAYLTFYDIPKLDDVYWFGGMPTVVQQLSEMQLSAAAIMKITSVLDQSPYVLQKAQFLPPAFLKSMEKNLSVKKPKDDPTKPALRVNIPEETSPSEDYSKLIRNTGVDTRSRSLMSRTKSPSFEDGLLTKSESEIEFPKFNDILAKTNFEGESKSPQLKYSFGVGKEECNEPSGTPLDSAEYSRYSNTENASGAKTSETSGECQTGEIVDPKGLYIIIDVPEKCDGNSAHEVATESRSSVPKDDFVMNRFSNKPRENLVKAEANPKTDNSVRKSRSFPNMRSNQVKSGLNKRFEVHETEDAATYIFHLRFNKNVRSRPSRVGCVPEKEITTRSETENYSDAPIKVRDTVVNSYSGIGKEIDFVKHPDPKKKKVRKSEAPSDTKSNLLAVNKPQPQLEPDAEANNEGTDFVDPHQKVLLERVNHIKEEKKNPKIFERDDFDTVRSPPKTYTFRQPEINVEKKQQEIIPQEASGDVTSAVKDPSPGTELTETQVSRTAPHTNVLSAPRKQEAVDWSASITTPVNTEPLNNLTQYYHSKEPEPATETKNTVESSQMGSYAQFYVPTRHGTIKDKVKSHSAHYLTIHDSDSAVESQQKIESPTEMESDTQEYLGVHELNSSTSQSGKKKFHSISEEQKYPEAEKKNPKKHGKTFKGDSDSSDFQTSANYVSIGCEKIPNTAMPFGAAFPPLLREALNRRFKLKKDFLSEKWTKIQITPKDPQMYKVSELSENSILFPKKESEKFDCESLLTSSEEIISNIIRSSQKKNTKMTDASFVEPPNKTPVDSLTVMKQVKDIIQLDLDNVVKIFKDGNFEQNEVVSSVVLLKENVWKIDKEKLEKQMEMRKNEMRIADLMGPYPVHKSNLGDNAQSSSLKHFPSKNIDMKLEDDQSVVTFNPNTNEFFINKQGLADAISRRTTDPYDEITQTLDMLAERNPRLMETKSGDSILVFDEETQSWKVDFSILEKREQQLQLEEELTKRSELILETFEKFEKDQLSTVPKPDTTDKKTFDYRREEWNTYSTNDSVKSKSPFRESNAEEIRKKNSDLYEDLFIAKKKDTGMDNSGKHSPGSEPSKTPKESKFYSLDKMKMASDCDSNSKNPENQKPESSQTPPVDGKQPTKTEDDNFWESFLKMDILPRDISEISKTPSAPSSIPGKTKEEEDTKTKPPEKKIDEPKFKIHLPFMGDKKNDKPKSKKSPTSKGGTEKSSSQSKVCPEKKKDPEGKETPPGTPGAKNDPKSEGTEKSPSQSKVCPEKKKDPEGKETPPGTPGAKNDPKTNTPDAGSSEKSSPSKEDSKPPACDPQPVKPPPACPPKEGQDSKPPTKPSKTAAASDHYISNKIIEISRNKVKDSEAKIKTNKLETVKLNISADKRLPSKITEINLNKKCEEKVKESPEVQQNPIDAKKTDDVKKKNKKLHKNFEKYKTPFSDPEYEEKSMKIKSDIESNPNLKKLDNWNKTLVLHDIMKPPENIESWLKDETDKMATLLLKILQEASDGKPKKKQPLVKPKGGDKLQGKGNPYESIRKKQENAPENFLFRVRTVNLSLENDKKTKAEDVKMSVSSEQLKDIPVQSGKTVKPPKVVDAVKLPAMGKDILASATVTQQKGAQLPMNVEDTKSRLSPTALEAVVDSNLVSRDIIHQNKPPLEITEDIPGPELLKKISNTWKVFPVLGSQMTIFTLLRLFQLVNMGSTIFGTSNPGRSRRYAFTKLFAKYGPIVNVQGPLSGNVILIHKPEHLTAVFEQDATTPVRSVFDSLEQCRRDSEEKFLTLGFYTDWNKPEWNELRKGTYDPLIKGCEKYLSTVEMAGDSFVSNIRRNRNGQNLVSEDFMEEIKKWSLEGLCTVVFEKSFGFLEGRTNSFTWIMEPDKLYMALDEATECLSKCERGFQTWRLMATPSATGLAQAYRTISSILSKQLYQAEVNLRNKSGLLKDGSLKELTFAEGMLLNDGMTHEEIICNLVDILLIGTNAMNSALGFLLYNLAENVKVQNKLFKELKEALPNKTSRLDYNRLNSLKYLQACVKENLRLHMPVSIFYRQLQNDILLSNYIVPKGTYVVMDYRVSCLKEQIYDDPDKFIPERWLSDEKWMQEINPFAPIPFCHGPRTELTKRVVEMQLMSCLAKIVRNFQVEYHFGEIRGTETIITFPDKPLKLNFAERDS